MGNTFKPKHLSPWKLYSLYFTVLFPPQGSAIVQYVNSASAEAALKRVHGEVIIDVKFFFLAEDFQDKKKSCL